MKTSLISTVLLCLFLSSHLLSQNSPIEVHLQKLDTITSTEDSIRVYIDIARILITGDPKASLDQVLIAKELSNRITDENLKFRLLFSEATAIRNMKNHKEALVLFERFIEHHKTSGDINNLTNGYQTAGSLYVREGEYDKGEAYLLKAKDYYIEMKDDYGLARNYRALGSLARRKADIPQALDYTFKALEIFEKLEDKQKMSNSHNSLGIIYSAYDDKVNAAKHFKINYQLSLEVGDKLRAANALQNLASTLDDPSESRRYMKKAIEVYDELGIPAQVAYVEFNLGTNYKRDSKLDSALYHLNQSSDIYARINQDPPAQLKLDIGDVYARMGQTSKAKILLDESANELDGINEVYELSSSYGLLSSSYAHIGDYEQAYKYRLRQNSFQDSIFKLDQNEQMAKLETTYKVKEKDLEIQALEAQSEVSELRLMRRNIIAGFLGLGVLIMGFLLYKIRTKNSKIENQNSIIKESLVEKETLLREIHHRVKNNLQIISSLLNIQSRSITDVKAKEAILIGKNRVHSMSLIHQNLYDKDNLTGIPISSYLPKLVTDLYQSYNTSLGEIDVVTDIEPLVLDVDTVIPIGLIVNELITNCLKYAFPDNADGKIIVRLHEINDHLLLSVADNGIGMTEEMRIERTAAFGHKIIKAFKAKLGADIEILGAIGTQVRLRITKYKKIEKFDETLSAVS